jgi:hypothetical protein
MMQASAQGASVSKKGETTVKKDNARFPAGRGDGKPEASRKQAGPRPPASGDVLTCSEAQVEDLLSEGEST